MCDFFISADPILYESRSRTVRIHGVVTSIRLENLMWDTLADIASDEGKSTNCLIATLHDEILDRRGEVANFSSFLRVTCLRYLVRKSATPSTEKPLQNTPSLRAVAGM